MKTERIRHEIGRCVTATYAWSVVTFMEYNDSEDSKQGGDCPRGEVVRVELAVAGGGVIVADRRTCAQNTTLSEL